MKGDNSYPKSVLDMFNKILMSGNLSSQKPKMQAKVQSTLIFWKFTKLRKNCQEVKKPTNITNGKHINLIVYR